MKKSAVTTTIMLLMFAAFSGTATAADNFSLIDSLMSAAAKEISEIPEIHSAVELSIVTTAHSADWLMEQHLQSTFAGKSFFTYDSTAKRDILFVYIHELTVEYVADSENSSALKRKINFTASGKFVKGNGKITPIPIINHKFSDFILSDEADNYNSRDYGFARAELPEQETGFFEQIAEPLIIIGSALLTVVLLFTVRSG